MKKYYLDTMILVSLDRNKLIETLATFKKKMNAKLLMTQTILDETRGGGHKMSDKFNDIIADGVIEVINDVVDESDREMEQAETSIVELGDGESSLIKLLVYQKEIATSVLLTNDYDALNSAVGLGIKTMMLTDYIIWLEKGRMLSCDEALVLLEKMISKLAKHRQLIMSSKRHDAMS